MRSLFLVVCVGVLAVSALLVTSRAGHAGVADAIVRLQSSSPGVQQVGNANLSGTIKAGQFQGGGAGITNVNAALLNGLPSGSFLQSVPVPLILTSSLSNVIVYAENQNTTNNSYGVLGKETGTSGATFGGYFLNDSTSGTGAYGTATASTGTTYGVYGTATSFNGFGVYGFVSSGSSNSGVYGKSTGNGGTGVVGEANTGTAAYGVWGKSSSGYAGFFSGNVQVSGTLSKTAGSFKIDHPLDPANKYLYHSFVESPDMMNVYNGLVTTDDKGFATITMPDWFDALNRDFRYQLTIISRNADDGWAMARVVQEMHDNSFMIQTNVPKIKVSWQVTGIRKDPYAERHRIPVEEDKPENERGYYLHPDLYGVSDEFRIENAKGRHDRRP